MLNVVPRMSDLKLQQSRLDGRFDIIECLGRGSYAEIYVAKDRAAQEGETDTVVIKALNVHLQGEPDADLERTLMANFQNEAVALDRVRHPNIISRLGHGTAIDLDNVTFHYIVLEYMSGGDLAARCRKTPLTLEEALFYLEQVCAGLAYAHSKGVIHRDIKPQNLLLSGDQQTVKIADFGVAKLGASDGAITRVGTNVYAPPEHNPLVQTGPLDTASLSPVQPMLTPAADIYSLAKTLYTLMVGEPPRRFAHRPITELPPELSSKPWSKAVLDVLQKATKNSPTSRYQTVEEFWDDLKEASLAPTMRLDKRTSGLLEPLTSAKSAMPAAPPKPDFRPSVSSVREAHGSRSPKIVVPVASKHGDRNAQLEPTAKSANEIISQFPDRPEKPALPKRKSFEPASRASRFLIALILLASFAGMLLATHYYISHRRNQSAGTAEAQDSLQVGSNGTSTTDVNLRSDALMSGPVVGLAEKGSRLRVLTVKNNWIEVQVLEHARAKTDPTTLDRGWINRRYFEAE